MYDLTILYEGVKGHSVREPPPNMFGKNNNCKLLAQSCIVYLVFTALSITHGYLYIIPLLSVFGLFLNQTCLFLDSDQQLY